MKHIQEFSKRAQSYNLNNIIQKKVASHLISKIKNNPKTILDLGSGTGEINLQIRWKYEKFIGVDSAKGMCEKHPKNSKTTIINSNFEDKKFQKDILKEAPFDLIISSSALQWAEDIVKLMKFIPELGTNIAFSIFTCGTFEDIYKISKIKTFLPKAELLIEISKKYFDVEYEIKRYKLEFEDNISKFRYIKKSGVSGGNKKLTISETKNLIKNYPHSYLEFEVLFLFGVKILK